MVDNALPVSDQFGFDDLPVHHARPVAHRDGLLLPVWLGGGAHEALDEVEAEPAQLLEDAAGGHELQLGGLTTDSGGPVVVIRSEEHTSELQSH